MSPRRSTNITKVKFVESRVFITETHFYCYGKRVVNVVTGEIIYTVAVTFWHHEIHVAIYYWTQK